MPKTHRAKYAVTQQLNSRFKLNYSNLVSIKPPIYVCTLHMPKYALLLGQKNDKILDTHWLGKK